MAPLSEAVHLYRGDFMAGFSLRDSEQFNEWQFFEAENLRRDLTEILAWAGQPAAALHEYHGFAHLLKKEFDILPSEDTTALIQSIKAGKIPPLPSIR